MNNIYVKCQGCDLDWYVEMGPKQEEVQDWPTRTCDFCEEKLCHGCYAMHNCHGHAAELKLCECCGEEIWIKEESKRLEPFCVTCLETRPWEKATEHHARRS